MTAAGEIGAVARHRQALNQGRFTIQRSRRTGEFCYPPRVAAPGSGADDLEWVEASGAGSVYAVTVVSRKPERGGDYNIAIVELNEGPRMMTRVVGVEPGDVYIGMKVRARIEVPEFGPLTGGDQAAVLLEPDRRGEG